MFGGAFLKCSDTLTVPDDSLCLACLPVGKPPFTDKIMNKAHEFERYHYCIRVSFPNVVCDVTFLRSLVEFPPPYAVTKKHTAVLKQGI